jgi:DNA-binding NtrC family response regulator
VLVVEPEHHVRAALSEALDASGYVVAEARTAQDAFAALEERSDVRVMVADLDMADAVDGLAFAHEVHRRWPALGMVITSGRVRHLPPSDIPGDGFFMPRPLPRQMFLEAVWVAAR